MDFRILGPLEVLDQGRVVDLGGSRQRALLALLLLHLNETLSIDRVIDELWGERRPVAASKTVHVQVSRLRKAIVPARGHSSDSDGVVVTRRRGYALMLDPERLDARRFEGLLAEAGRELAAGRAERAAGAFERALALWRGAPLADLAYEPFAQPEIRRLDELRVAALEQQIEADLALGRHADVVGRLPALIGEFPYREHLRGQLMLALYRCDRQADALQAYRDARRALVEELGIEPGERLRELHGAILAQDPALSLPVSDLRPAPDTDDRDAPPAGARRLVTVVVANVVNVAGPAALAEPLDPESLHAVVASRAAVCADVFERHGGTVEKFDGDTAVGMFGLRSLHEDDALRAVRAALEIRAAGAATLGISSGEVYVGAGARGEMFATGDVKRVAARLDEAAGDGEILLGQATHRLVAAHVVTESLEPFAVRGRQVSVRAFRLLELRSGEPVALRSAATPFIGREPQRIELRELLARADGERACHLVTVIGPAGIGKSRLAREFIDDVSGDAGVVVGRCLSYGDGITYRPLAEIVDQLSGGDPERGIAELLEGEHEAGSIGRRVLGAIGLADESAQAVETFWAVRRLLEAAARRRPLVVVIDDAHWAEPTLLDLLEYVVAFSSGSPILLLCLARPELLESRPAWAAPQPVRTMLTLKALSDSEAQAFVETLAVGELEPHATGRIVETAEGNPLFLEQLILVRAEQDLAALPPSIEAVLAARIQRLEVDERAVLLHASVEGRSFHRGAVAALMSQHARDAISAPLMGLVRKQLIRPDRPELAGEDAFRFAHALIREAAYCGMPKRLRADLHERLAGWLKTKPGVADEILGYHLEQAFRHRLEIGAIGDRDRVLATEASGRLATAARAARVRGDATAGARLLERAMTLLGPDDPGRPELLSTLAAGLVEAGRLADASRFLAEALERAVLEGDVRFESRARVDQQLVRLHEGTSGGHEQARHVADAALSHLERHGDDLGQCRAWRLRAWIAWIEGLLSRADEAWQRAATHARRAGDERELFEILGWRASAAVLGPTPVAEAIRRCAQIREQVRNSPLAVALTLHPLGLLHAMTGDFDLAHELIREGNESLDELGRMESAVSHHEALVEMLDGRPEQAEARLRPGYEKLERMGEHELLATTAALLARAVYAQDRPEEAEELCRVSERIAAREDVVTQIMWRGTQARLHARRGDAEKAEALGREAVRLAEPTDLLVVRADALLDLEEAARIGGRRVDAQAAARRAIELYEQKGDSISAARARSRLRATPEPVALRSDGQP